MAVNEVVLGEETLISLVNDTVTADTLLAGITAHSADGEEITGTVVPYVPYQIGSLTYTGSAQTPTWNDFSADWLTIGGTTSATNVGAYTATFTPVDGFTWSDGTTTAKSVAWSIGKATGTLTINPTTLSLGVSNTTGSITVTRAGDGAISASSSNTAAATVSVSGTTVTVTAKGAGSATITVTVAAGTNYTAPTSKTCTVTAASIPSTTLSANSWGIISEASLAGVASDYWEVGDEKDITVDGETITLVIMGFNHDTKASGGTAGITFGMKNLMSSERAMNSSNTNSGGFTGTTMYTWLQGTLLSSLPSDLQSVLLSVKKKTSAGGGSSAINTTSMKVFLFSEIEVFGSVTYSKSGEGSQYAYFATGATKIKYLTNGAGSAYYWWERSPYASNSTSFCYVYGSGSAGANYASISRGVCFGFCV